MKNKLYIITTALFLLVGMGSANARPIPPADQVTVDGKTWAKVDIFSGLSWDIINAQCPAGVCGANSTLNGFDMAGWVWATSHEATKMLSTFKHGTGFVFQDLMTVREVNSAWAKNILLKFGCTQQGRQCNDRYHNELTVVLRENEKSLARRIQIFDAVDDGANDQYVSYSQYKVVADKPTSAFFYKP